MKNLILTLLFALPFLTMAAEPDKPGPGKGLGVVFEVSVEGADKWEAALRNVENAKKELGPGTKIEVVAHGKGIGLVLGKTTTESAELKARLERLHADGVVFAGCENTLARMKIDRKELVAFATTVPSGVAEIIRKQADGWAYIKSGG